MGILRVQTFQPKEGVILSIVINLSFIVLSLRIEKELKCKISLTTLLKEEVYVYLRGRPLIEYTAKKINSYLIRKIDR